MATEQEQKALDRLDKALEARDLDPQRARDVAAHLRDLLDDDATIVDLASCIGAECIRTHGARLATRRGTGPASIYLLCDECFEVRLEAEAKPLMVEVRGVGWIRHLGLHELHQGVFPDRQRQAEGT